MRACSAASSAFLAFFAFLVLAELPCDDWLVRCGGGSVRVETKSRQHQQCIRAAVVLVVVRPQPAVDLHVHARILLIHNILHLG